MKKKFCLVLTFGLVALAMSLSACSSSGSSSSGGTSDECTENPSSPNCTTDESEAE